jgi:hypothetical protein
MPDGTRFPASSIAVVGQNAVTNLRTEVPSATVGGQAEEVKITALAGETPVPNVTVDVLDGSVDLTALTNAVGIATFSIAGFAGQNFLAHSGAASTSVELSWTPFPGETFTPLPLPTITAVKALKGHAAGGKTVTITGTNFTRATAVKFGAVDAVSFVVKSDTTIKAIAPAETAGTVDLTVTTPKGRSAISSVDHYKFGPPTITAMSVNGGSTAGGTTVTVTGTGFALSTSGTVIKFGRTSATSVSCTSITSCTVVSPSHAVGIVDVRATVAGMKSPKVTADQFTYRP